MNLQIGTRLGPYEIVAPIGAGGMGEVYRARDTRLDRTVAIKILPAELAQDAKFRVRFEREAKAISSLNHPHICSLYDVGDSYLVMEYCEGKTLATRIAEGALPFAQVLQYGMEIADALDKAHRKGIIHRDLKPANVMLTKSGVKLLDFGLAKQHTEASPTTATLKRVTEEGHILGTIQYMAPELLEGKEADSRSDIFALGLVLYEMTTGKPAFTGATRTSLIAAILEHELKPITELRLASPPALSQLIGECLSKDPDERIQTAHDVALELKWISEGQDVARVETRRSRAPVIVTAVVALAAVALAFWIGRRVSLREQPPTMRSAVTRSVIDLTGAAPLALGTFPPEVGYSNTAVALSPDGSLLVYVGSVEGQTQLFKRRLDREEVEPIPGTQGAREAFFSPDGKWLGIIAGKQLLKISLSGGAPVILANIGNAVRGVWTEADQIYVTEAAGRSVIRVPAQGGEREGVLDMNSRFVAAMADVLPDGSALIMNIVTSASGDFSGSALFDLKTRTMTPLLDRAYDVRYVDPGLLVFARGGELLAVRFDARRRAVIGAPVVIASGVAMTSFFRIAQYALSPAGSLAYVAGSDASIGRLAWVDRGGRSEFLPVPDQRYNALRLSPDDSRIAVHIADIQDFIWIYDIQRREGRQLAAATSTGWPVWTSDGRNIIAASRRPQGGISIMEMDAIGGRAPRELAWTTAAWAFPGWISADGRLLGIMQRGGAKGGVLDLATHRGGPIGTLRDVPFAYGHGDLSPDSRWILGGRRGTSEIWVTSMANMNEAYQISNGGGTGAAWCRACPELFYRNGSRWYSVHVLSDSPFRSEPARLAWETDFIVTVGRAFDVTRDGKRLLVSKRTRQDVIDRIHLVRNWPSLLSASR